MNRSSTKKTEIVISCGFFLVTIEIPNPVANLKPQNKKILKIKCIARVENIIAFIENPLNLLSPLQISTTSHHHSFSVRMFLFVLFSDWREVLFWFYSQGKKKKAYFCPMLGLCFPTLSA